VPLIVLAFFSIFAGYLGFPRSLGGENRFEEFLKPVFAPTVHELQAAGHGEQVAAGKEEVAHHDPTEYALMFASVAAAAFGWWFAKRNYANADRGFVEPIAKAVPVYQVLYNKWYVDEAYDYLFTGRRKLGPVRLGAMGLGEATWKFDANVIDGGVNGAGWMTRFSGTLSVWWDKWIIDGLLVNGIAILTRLASYPVRLVQWGLVQWYAFVMVIGLLGFALYYVLR
jgi:NADH-quinone oxidoreductase subunit L